MKPAPHHFWHCASFLFGSVLVASAIPVTFRVDMSGAAGFNPITDLVEVHGTFNGWSGGFSLTPSANPNVLTNTFDITDAPGTVEYFKFTWNSNYELQGMGNRDQMSSASRRLTPAGRREDKGCFARADSPANGVLPPFPAENQCSAYADLIDQLGGKGKSVCAELSALTRKYAASPGQA